MKKDKTPVLLYRGEAFNPNFHYYSGLDIGNSFLLIEGGRKKLLVSPLEEPGARKAMKKAVVLEDFFPYLKKELKGKKVKIDGSRLPARIYERLRKFCRPVDASVEFYTDRMFKNKDEVEKIRKATRITKEIIDSLEIKKGMTENEVRKQLLLKTLEKGLEPAYEPIVASGSNTAAPHHVCTNKRIEEFALIDFGVKVGNYCSDITRCFAVSRSRVAEQDISLYRSMHDVFDMIVDEMPSFENGGELAGFAAKVFRAKKLPAMIHAIGHGIGLDVHEFPRLNRKYKDSLKGAVFTIEPAAYYKTYGARFEEVVYYDGKKARVL